MILSTALKELGMMKFILTPKLREVIEEMAEEQ